MRNIALMKTTATNPPPRAVVNVPVHEATLSRALEMTASCFHDSSLTGNFTVGSDYIISGNLSPDLGMGLFGVRRMGSPSEMDLYTSQLKVCGGDLDVKTGEIHQRVMAQS